ncbi:hypothetical protein M231_05165 [Tremella mesenterica]|uniref:Major facilitator superfamily (MFS) profile domain-containing protein n=1 Tax=Tremella mesenterica TaxID=5217 RepID=A0A4Q1BIS7_TREME|nr:hypothetical protein M231_05165 [Tremella mesenterica]
MSTPAMEREVSNTTNTTTAYDDKPAAHQIERGGRLPHVIEADELAQEKDDAAKALEGQDLDYTDEEVKRVKFKTDFIIVPLMHLGIGCLLVDKTALNAASTLGFQTDLGLHGSQYSWAVSIYYFGLLGATYPATLLLQRYHVGRVLATAYIIWGGLMLCTMAVKNYHGLLAIRFMLGIFESTAAPAFTATTARFYTQSEQPIRYAMWSLGNTLMPIPFLLLYFAIGHAPSHPLAAWRWIFCLLGLFTIALGSVMMFVFPDKPSTCWWYTERQRAVAVARIARSQTGIKSHLYRKYQIVEAFTDVKTWLFAFLFVFQQPAPGIASNFSGVIIKGYGYTGLKALLLQIPSWAVPSVFTPLCGYLTTHVNWFKTRKCFVMVWLGIVSLISEIVLYKKPPVPGANKAVPLAFMSLLSIDQSAYPLILSLIGQNISGTTKKQTVIAITFVLYCVANICIPQSFLAKQSPRYQDGIIFVIASQAMFITLSIVFWILATAENKRREKLDEGRVIGADEDKEIILSGLADETDKRNPRFRYSP